MRERDRQTDRQAETDRERQTDRETETETDRQTDRQTDRDRKYNKVQACLGFENLYSKFSPILGLFQGLPGRLDWFLYNKTLH